MTQYNLSAIRAAWETLQRASDLGPIRNAAHYKRMLALTDQFVDSGLAAEHAPLEGLFGILCDLIADYDAAHYTLPDASPEDVLRFLMRQHDLKQADLPEIGGQSVVSLVLAGKRKLNTRQIAALAARFAVPADVFLDRVRPSRKSRGRISRAAA